MDRRPLLALPVSFAWTLALALPAVAQNQPAKRKSDAAARGAPTFAALHVAADELPAGYTFQKELACVSPQPATLFEDDIYSQILPKAKHQDFQTIAGPTAKGSLLYFDWGDKIPEAAELFIPGLLFGEKERSTEEHPEQIVRVGGTMVIVSFPLGSEERRFVVDRLRVKFGLRLAHDFGEAKASIKTLFQFFQKKDSAAGLKYAADHEKELAGVSFAAFLEGELAVLAGDWARADQGYARALALDATSDPLPDDGAWFASKDGHGNALMGLKKNDEAARELAEAAQIAAAQKRPKDQSRSLYNVACCRARLGQADAAIATLKQAIALDPRWKAAAAKDDDFESIAARPEFQALVK